MKKETVDPKYLKPHGLYGHFPGWDLRTVRRMILDKKLAPFYPPRDDKGSEPNGDTEECPICFMNYPGGLNRAKCCNKGVCTECYLMIKKPNASVPCPFCNRPNYVVTYSGPLTKEEREREEREQQKVIELQIKMRQEEIENDKQRQREREAKRRQEEEEKRKKDEGEGTNENATAPKETANERSKQNDESEQNATHKSTTQTQSQSPNLHNIKRRRREKKERLRERTREKTHENEATANPSQNTPHTLTEITPRTETTSSGNEPPSHVSSSTPPPDYITVDHFLSQLPVPITLGPDGSISAEDLEDLMLLEAIRRSLVDVSLFPQSQSQNQNLTRSQTQSSRRNSSNSSRSKSPPPSEDKMTSLSPVVDHKSKDVFTNETQNVGRDDMARSRSSSSSTSTSKYMNPITPEEQTQQHIQTDTNLFVDSDGEESIIQYESANTADNHSLEDVVDEKLLDMSHTRHQRNPSKGKVSLGESITTSNSDMDKELPNLLDTPPQSSLNNNIINTQSNSNITNTNCSIKPVDIPSASTESQVPFSSTSDLTSTSTSTSVSTTLTSVNNNNNNTNHQTKTEDNNWNESEHSTSVSSLLPPLSSNSCRDIDIANALTNENKHNIEFGK
jgi:hypothetical protein